MSDIAETIEPTPAAPKKKRGRPPRRAPRTVVPFVAPDEFAGMTATMCCNACTPERCVISGVNVCAHPNKGGLQSGLMNKPDVAACYLRARKALEHQKIDLTGG